MRRFATSVAVIATAAEALAVDEIAERPERASLARCSSPVRPGADHAVSA